MPTKQDKIKPAIAIRLGGAFPTQRGSKARIYPEKRLLEFLRVNIKDDTAIINYCNNYRFIPRDMRKDLIDGFKREHKKINDMAQKLSSGTATEKDLAKIDRILNTHKIQTHYLGAKDIEKINDAFGGGPVPLEYVKRRYLLQFTKHKGTIVSLWEDMINQIIINQNLKTCIECGKFFWVTKAVKTHKFCSDPCRDNRNHRLAHRKKKAKENT